MLAVPPTYWPTCGDKTHVEMNGWLRFVRMMWGQDEPLERWGREKRVPWNIFKKACQTEQPITGTRGPNVVHKVYFKEFLVGWVGRVCGTICYGLCAHRLIQVLDDGSWRVDEWPTKSF